jgi:cytochrome b561
LEFNIKKSSTDAGLRLIRVNVYGPTQRVLHWWIALSTLGLIATGILGSRLEPGTERSFVWTIHIGIGKILILGFLGRIIWGFIGPVHARFSSLLFFPNWFRSLRRFRLESADGNFGHHPQAAVGYIGFYFLLVIMVGSGLLLASIIHGDGPLGITFLDNFKFLDLLTLLHGYTWYVIAAFIAAHIGALVFHEWIDRIPLAQSMISGFQYRSKKEKLDDQI